MWDGERFRLGIKWREDVTQNLLLSALVVTTFRKARRAGHPQSWLGRQDQGRATPNERPSAPPCWAHGNSRASGDLRFLRKRLPESRYVLFRYSVIALLSESWYLRHHRWSEQRTPDLRCQRD